MCYDWPAASKKILFFCSSLVRKIWGESYFRSDVLPSLISSPIFTIKFHFRLKWTGDTMYESSCSYQTALDLKRTSPIAQVIAWQFNSKRNFFSSKCNPSILVQVKSEECFGLTQCSPDWASYRFHQSTFEQLKQSVEKAKAVLQDRTGFLGTSAFR